MKIIDVKTFLVNPGIPRTKNLLFVKIETDEGISGWGECYTQPDREIAIEAYVKKIARYLIGRNPFNIKHFTYRAYFDFASMRGSMDFYCAISGIEHAMWDITGKALEVPVYNLLGGACRDKIRVYANGWDKWYAGKGIEQVAKRAEQLVEQGFTALKFDPIPGPRDTHISREKEKEAIESVRAVRDAVGPDIDLLIEIHCRLAPMHAIRIAKEIEKYNPFWYEEPVSSCNISALSEVKGKIDIPVVTGEELYTKKEFREVFENRSADIINPDVANCGGILELKEIAAMAEPYQIIVSPHNYNSTTIALAATIQTSAVIPNFLITEYFINFVDFGNDIAVIPFRIDNGYINLPTAPGLGIELDEKKLAEYPYRDVSRRRFREYYEEENNE